MSESPTPVVVLASSDPVERDVAVLTALLDAPGYVAIVHEITPDKDGDPQLIRRVVTIGGEQRLSVPLEHACPGCAMREDAVPAIVEHLGARPEGIVLALPIGAEILPATRTLSAAVRCGALNGARLAGAVATVPSEHLLDALADGDDAVVAHLMCASILIGGGGGAARDVMDALRARGSVVLADACEPWLTRAVAIHHDDAALERICDPETMAPGHGLQGATVLADGTAVTGSGVWQLTLRSRRPFHPDRLLRAAQDLAPQGAVVRGRFWLPNRPDSLCGWDAVGGCASIGVVDRWSGEERDTVLQVTGYDADPGTIRTAFEAALLTPAEHAAGAASWLGRPDPLAHYLSDRT